VSDDEWKMRHAWLMCYGSTAQYITTLAADRTATREAALVEAAEVIEQMYFGPDQSQPFTTGAKHKWGARQAALRVREMAEGGE